ncbi:unnamed protein product [Rotaria sordida]|uniref:EGF-like domain-containing protein n=1 Tax=Rotaria sordida TaxID=392033 RepID=A0A818W9W0_9BILA|nr:unnamed protein product [Rotaria sordida]
MSDVSKDADTFICVHRFLNKWEPLTYFKLRNVASHPLPLTNTNTLNQSYIEQTTISSIIQKPRINYTSSEAWRCNRGVSIRIRIDSNQSRLYCLCPPSYYGDECQYQNQRVSLTVQIRVSSDWKKLFIFLLTLNDNEKNIESYNYIEYLPIRDCNTKYNTYLLYSIRPKNSSKKYSVQIDAFDQLTLTHRTSWIYPLEFTFLPVHRLSVLLKNPMFKIESIKKQCWPPCIHGQCLSYINNQNLTYCHCESGWSGIQCNVNHTCNCAPGSLCISSSICLCPSGRFGHRCYLVESSCQSQTCLHGERCVIKDIRYRYSNQNQSICICPQGCTGDHCEYRENQTEIDLSFDDLETIPSSLLIHLILIEETAVPKRTSIMKKIRFDEYSIKILTSVMFHMAFAQILKDYYLIIIHENPFIFEQISTKIISSYRCRSIVELFDEIFSNRHILKRVKYYHIPCQKNVELNCFYDEVHICLCTRDRQANCFEFDHNMKYDCNGSNFCEHQGNCFLDDDKYPTSAFCACPNCYFGSKCQFSTKGSTLSLDIFLGYHIRSSNGLNQQQIIIKIAIMLFIVIFVFGSINAFLSFQTFRQKHIQNVGCVIYLYASSIISMIIIIFLALKFSFLLLIHIGSITNRTFYYIQCLSIDFLLRSLLCTNDWLSAFVAIERAMNVVKGVKFNKTKSKQLAKWMILIIMVFISITFIYDPLHRNLVDDEEEQRVWCVTKYSSSMQTVDWIMNIFHFSLPLLINFISSLVIIFILARTRSKSQKTKSYEEHLFEQIKYHKHLLISPFLLVTLAVPRLIISFLSSCMKSARDSWFYLFGYFISFIPSILTLGIFILPSKICKETFKKVVSNMWQ